MLSDEQIGKKEIEGDDLSLFLEAYEWVTGEHLLYHPFCSSSECPDFVCVRSNGEPVGIELTRVMRDPETARWDRILHHKHEQEVEDTMSRVFDLLEKKDRTRSANYGTWADKTMLVLQLFDCSLPSLEAYIDSNLQKGFSVHGFIEVWLADYTGIEAYGDIELFGLFPSVWWGYHQRPNPCRKPYG